MAFGDQTEWGDHSENAGGEDIGHGGSGTLPREIDIGGGFKLVLHPDAFRTIMHTPQITSRVRERCEELTNMANSMATVEGAEYTYFVSNNPENIRARGRVKPGNEAAIIDDRLNSTLLKALASVGSDPLPASYGGWSGSDSAETTSVGDELGEIAEAIGEALE